MVEKSGEDGRIHARFRRKDQVHVQDMIGVRLIDPSWLTKLPPELAGRLKEILDTPDG
jgi:hypothetical protein